MRAVPSGAAGPDWAHAPSYIRGHLAAHAAAAGLLDGLLEDPRYLLTVDPARLVPHLDAARSAPARATAAVYRQSAHRLARLDRPARASQLELTAHHLGCRSLAARIAGAAPDRPWQTRWSHGPPGHRPPGPHRPRPARCARWRSAALPDGTPVIVSGGGDGTVRVWRLADGAPVGEPLHRPRRRGAGGGGRGAAGRHPGHRQRRRRRHGAGVAAGRRRPGRGAADRPRPGGEAVAVGALPDGTPVIVSGGRDGTVRVWRLADGAPVGKPLHRPRRRRGERGGGRGAAGRHPGHRQRRRRRHGAGVAAGRRRPGREAAAPATAAGWTRWRSGRCRTAPRSSSAAATRRHGAGVAAGRRRPGREAAAPATPAG